MLTTTNSVLCTQYEYVDRLVHNAHIGAQREVDIVETTAVHIMKQWKDTVWDGDKPWNKHLKEVEKAKSEK